MKTLEEMGITEVLKMNYLHTTVFYDTLWMGVIVLFSFIVESPPFLAAQKWGFLFV